MAHGSATIDHGKIKGWVEERGGCPAHVKGSGNGGDLGILRIDYTGFSGKHSLEPISWEQFFDAFEHNKLAFLYQEGKDGRFSKLISRKSAKLEDAQQGRGKSAAAKKAASKAQGKSTGKAKSSSKAKSTSKTKSTGKAKSTSKAKSTRTSKAKGKTASKPKGTINALYLLEQQHREIEKLFERMESAKSASQKGRAFEKLADALAAHARIEETMFYPAAFAEATESELREAVEEHLVAKRLLTDLMGMEPSNPQFTSKITVLREVVEHHVEEEEETLFEMVREQDIEDLEVLGARMRERYAELMKSSPRDSVAKEIEKPQAPF